MKKTNYTIEDVKMACKEFKAKGNGDFALNVWVVGHGYETEHSNTTTELVKAIRSYAKTHKIEDISTYDQAGERILDVWMKLNH